MELFGKDTVPKTFKDLSGKVVNEYKVISFVGWCWADVSAHERLRIYYYNCLCNCGKTFLREHRIINNPKVIACGCGGYTCPITSRIDSNKTYKSWKSMCERCFSINNVAYPKYGGRGITVCQRWLEEGAQGFWNFLEDMGERPDGMTLDRIDVNRGYSAENCRWANGRMQAFNTRKSGKNTSGRTGVYWNKTFNKWTAYIRIGGKSKHLGYFENFEEAVAVRELAEIEVYGFNKE